MAKKDKDEQKPMDETGEGFTFNMEEQEEETYPVLPAGRYQAVIDKVEYQISRNSGNPMWKETILITEPDVADKNLKVFNYHVMREDMMGRVRKFLNRVAPELVTADFNPKTVADDGSLVGKECVVKLAVRPASEEYSASNEVKEFFAAGSTSGGNAATGDGGFNM